MFTVRAKAYQLLSQLLRLDPQGTFGQIQKDVIPVQTMDRCLEAEKCSLWLFIHSHVVAATTVSANQWADASDWSEILVTENGISRLVSADRELPGLDVDKVLLAVGLEITGTIASYTSASVNRALPNTINSNLNVAEFGAVQPGVGSITPTNSNVLPMRLLPNEADIEFREEVSAGAGQFNFSLLLLTAPRGVLPPLGS